MKLSIITINRNNAAGLRKTIESVFSQTYREFEYIVVDGASDDDSVNVIKELESEGVRELGAFKWISEPDTGIYNAMNKGIEIVSGLRFVNALNRSERSGDKNKGIGNKATEEGYVLMLNSGDFLADEHVIERIIPELDGTDIIQGNNIEERESVLYRDCGYCKSEIDFFDVMKGYFLHQASFCKRDLFERLGYFDESYRIAGDTKFFMKCLGVGDATYKYVNVDVANYDMNGVSAGKSGAIKNEYSRVLNELFSTRMVKHFAENEKKIHLYNQLHKHKWIWYLTMLLARICVLFDGKQDGVIVNAIKK